MNTPWYLGNGNLFVHGWGSTILGLALWSVVWTGLALWHAARRHDKGWFIFFLFVHTAGIVEILYLAFVVKVFTSGFKSEKLYKKKTRT